MLIQTQQNNKKQQQKQNYYPQSSWPCKSLSDTYTLQTQIGHGTYGSVYKAVRLENQKLYALKKMQNFQTKNNDWGFPITTLREIKLLQKLSHQNILNINQVVYQKPRPTLGTKPTRPPSIYLCLDLMQFDLQYMIKQQQYQFTIGKIQTLLKQILSGLNYLHKQNVSHRDIKPANILINNQGVVKIADFGLAKKLAQFSTVKVCTMWYRAPELFLGYKNYMPNIDVWSVGCIAVEFLIREPLFFSQMTERDQIMRIFQLCGTPDKCGWLEQAEKLQIYKSLQVDYSIQSQVIYYLKKNAPDHLNQDSFFDLVQKMLRLNPYSRYTAEDCLNHSFFRKQFTDTDIQAEQMAKKKQSQNQEKDRLKKKVKY